MTRSRIALALLTLLTLEACAFQRYRYFSLEQTADAVVVERGSPKLPQLHFAYLPLRYAIQRDRYRLDFFTPAQGHSYLPSVEVRALGAQLACPGVGSDDACTDCGALADDPSALRFSRVRCDPAQAPSAPLRFDVFADDGTLLASETIPFAIDASGFYDYTDLP